MSAARPRLAAALLALAGAAGAQAPVPQGEALERALVGLWCSPDDDGRFEACGRAAGDSRPFRGSGRFGVVGQRMCYVVDTASENFWLRPGARYCTDIVAIDRRTHRYRDIDTQAEFVLQRRPVAQRRCPS